MVTPYPPENCGIAIYASKLVTRLANHVNVVVIGNKNGQDELALDSKLRIVRSWKKASPLYIFEIVKGVAEESPHIVHVQHEYLAYGPRKYSILFPVLLLLIRLLRKPIVLTMHSVVRRSRLTDEFFFFHQAGRRFAAMKRALMMLFTKIIVYLSNAVVVHNNYMKNALVQDYYIKQEKIVVVPHGMEASPIVPSGQAKRILGLSQKQVLLFFGFVIPGKGLETLIKSFSKVSQKISNMILVIAGQYHPRLFIEFPRYLGTIEKLIQDLKLGDRVIFENRFIDNQRLQRYISAADIVVFPYIDDSILGASGALATCASQGKVVIATRIPRFICELKDDLNAIIVEPNNESQLVDAILRVSGDPRLGEKLQLNLHSYALERSWDAASLSTFELYARILRI